MFFSKKNKNESMIYKRKAERYMVYIPAVMYVVDTEYEREHLETMVRKDKLIAYRGVIINISHKGMLMLKLPTDVMHKHQPPLREKKNVALKFHLPIQMNEISISGVIAHLTKKDVDFPEVSLVGIEFAKVSFIDIVSLEEYIHADPTEQAPNTKNKRKFARLKSDRPALVSDKQKKFLKDQKCKIGDISATGVSVFIDMSLVSASAFQKMQDKIIKEVDVAFNVSTGGRLIRAHCEVCRVSTTETHVVLGLRFIDISEKDQLTVLKYVALKREKFLGED